MVFAALLGMDDDQDNLKPSSDRTFAVAGLVAGLVPFVLSTSSSHTVTVNGVVTTASYRDMVAIVGGVVAIVCSLIALVATRKSQIGSRYAFPAVVLVLGAYQLARGFGML
jgi:hypothetical protein